MSYNIPPQALHMVKRNIATHVATPTISGGKWRHAANKARGIERWENTSEHPETAFAVSYIRLNPR
jgi:hypothetical protein